MSTQTVYLIVLNELHTNYWKDKDWVEELSDEHPVFTSREEAQKVVDRLNQPNLEDPELLSAYEDYRRDVEEDNAERAEKIRVLRLARSTGIAELIQMASFHDTGYRKLLTLWDFAKKQRHDDEEASYYEVVERELR